MVTFKYNNGSWEIHLNGKYVGLISQSPPTIQAMNPGEWAVVITDKTDNMHISRGHRSAGSAKERAKTMVKSLMRHGLL